MWCVTFVSFVDRCRRKCLKTNTGNVVLELANTLPPASRAHNLEYLVCLLNSPKARLPGCFRVVPDSLFPASPQCDFPSWDHLSMSVLRWVLSLSHPHCTKCREALTQKSLSWISHVMKTPRDPIWKSSQLVRTSSTTPENLRPKTWKSQPLKIWNGKPSEPHSHFGVPKCLVLGSVSRPPEKK